jgi:hypothetical protein
VYAADAVINAATPVITTQPLSAAYTTNDAAAALTAAATVSDGGTLTYQWYSTDGGAIAGATGDSYTPETETAGTRYYYVVVTNTNTGVNGAQTAIAISSFAVITVNPPATVTYTVQLSANNTGYGTVWGADVYDAGATATVVAIAAGGYRFVNWTKDGVVESTNNPYYFTVTGDVDLTANFVIAETGLTKVIITEDFDKYVVTKWGSTFALDLAKLESEGYTVTGCKWYKNDEEIGTGFTYTADPANPNKLEIGARYSYVLIISALFEIHSTDKVITGFSAYTSLLAYPNPVQSGSAITIEGVTEGSAIEVYSQTGMRVSHTIVTGTPATLTLQVPAGIYIIRTAIGEVKIVVR